MKILLVVYDNESMLSWFPQGLGYIAAVCRKAGHEVVIYSQDVYHWPEDLLTEYLDHNRFDMVGIGVIAGYFQYQKLLKLSQAINRSKQRPFYVLGGHGPSPEPEYFLQKTAADAVILGEGEETVLDLLSALEDKRSLAEIPGLAFMDNGACRMTPVRPLPDDLDDLPFPAWDLFEMSHYLKTRFVNMSDTDLSMPVLSGRGCPFRCNFCYRMVEGFRPRAVPAILEEIRALQSLYNVTYIVFSDELLMASVERTMEICEAILSSGLRFKWSCNGRLNFAKSKVLQKMKEAGCVFINYGIESLDQQALKVMNKALTVPQIEEGIKNTLQSGISPGFNIIFGNIGETKESLQKGLDFLLKYNDYAQMRTIRPVTPYPGSPLYYYAIEKGLLKDCADFYENKHLNSDLVSVNFTDIPTEEIHRELARVNEILVKKYYEHKVQDAIQQVNQLYYESDTAFRGFRR